MASRETCRDFQRQEETHRDMKGQIDISSGKQRQTKHGETSRNKQRTMKGLAKTRNDKQRI